MSSKSMLRLVVAVLLAIPAWTSAQAAIVKVGVALPYSGVGAELATQIDRGIELFIQENPDAFGGHAVELIKRDLEQAGGDIVTNRVQELLSVDQVDILTGFVFSPNAIASAPLVTNAKVPMIIMNGAAAWIPKLSPYIARVSFTTWQAGYPLGRYAHEELGCKTAATGFTDYPAGQDARDAFGMGFQTAGGKLLIDFAMGNASEVPDFTPFFRRILDVAPDCLYVFVPAGMHTAALLDTYIASGAKSRGIRLLGPGGLTQDNRLLTRGEEMIGLITMHHYSADYNTPVNRAFVAAWKEAYGEDTAPDFMGLGGWDGMAAIAHAIRAQDGDITAEGTMKVLAGWQHQSPRGSILIDPETMDVVHDQHVHQVVQGAERLMIKVLDSIPQVRDPCKALKIGKCK